MPPIEEKPFPNSAASKTKAGAEELQIGNLKLQSRKDNDLFHWTHMAGTVFA